MPRHGRQRISASEGLSPALVIRQSRGLSQLQVAAAAGVGQGAVHGVELCRLTLPVSSYVKVAYALGVAPSALIPGFDAVPTSAPEGADLIARVRGDR